MIGLVVGKFYPPHRGHKHLIDTARRQVDHLNVLLPHHPSQKIPGELRRDWLREIHPDCEIHLVPDELENDSAQWARFTLDFFERVPDIVFSSEAYGPEYARLMGCRHQMVDQQRLTIPISGTRIRQSPLDCLDMLEPCVRAYFARRVVLIGAESTGKTTIAEILADRLKTCWVPEYGREYWEKKVTGCSMEGPLPAWKSDEFLAIAAEQQRRENLMARSANRVLICDTNAWATGTWHERYMGSRSAQVDEIGARDKADLYLLTHPDFPFVQDGWRDGQAIRDWMHERFATLLDVSGLPVSHLKGPLDRRLDEASRLIAELLRKPFGL